MKLVGIEIDRSKLMTKSELLAFLMKNGESDRALSVIRERYYETFGNELIWHYPISDGKHRAVFVVIVQEGFVSLPYDVVDKEDYEILELDSVTMFDAETLKFFIDDFKLFSDDLLAAIVDMLSVEQPKQPDF